MVLTWSGFLFQPGPAIRISMKTFYKVVALVAGLCGAGLPARSQPSSTPPARDLTAAVVAAQQQYNASFAGLPQLYNGPEYIDYSQRYKERFGHQFFDVPEPQSGSVDYNGHQFPNIQLAYDVVRDQVVVPVTNSPLTLRLVNEHVRAFTINEHRFVRVVADSSMGPAIGTGHYEVLVDSCVQVVAKRTKRLHEQLAQRAINAEFVEADRYFIQKAGVYYAVSSKATVVRAFAGHSRELQQFVRAQALKFNKKEFNRSLVRLARYYCSLPAQ